jgi:transcription-repair coupling factor (superfamily II helicase)
MRLARLAEGASYKAAVETVSLKVPVGPDRRTPLRDVALLENLHATLRAVLDEGPPAPHHSQARGGALQGA